MSSALAMALMAAMAVPGNGPETVSGEMEQEQELDLSGEWEGTLKDGDKDGCEVRFGSGRLVATRKKGALVVRRARQEWESLDEGRGKMRLIIDGGRALGIYKQEGSFLVICYRAENRGRPTSFHADDKQYLLILHRVKPRK